MDSKESQEVLHHHHRPVVENPRVLRLEDEEQALQLLVDEDEDASNPSNVLSPAVRSLSMSRNMAVSLTDEVSHMIRLPPPSSTPTPKKTVQKSLTSTSQAEFHAPSSLTSFSLSNPEKEVKSLMLSSGVSLVETKTGCLSSSSLTTNSSPSPTSVLTGICVSRWDDIVGPQTVYLWTEQLTSLFFPTSLPPSLAPLVKYVTDHTVDHHRHGGEDAPPSSSHRSIFVLVPALSLVYLSLSFRVPSPLDSTAVLEFDSSTNMTADHPDHPPAYVPHALSVLAPIEYLPVFLLLRPLLLSWLAEFAPKTGVLLAKNKLQNSLINSWCAELCKTVSALRSCWVRETIDEHKDEEKPTTSVKAKSKSVVTLKEKPRKVSSTGSNDLFVDFLPPNLKNVPKSAWAGIVSSHLATGGASLVVGKDNVAVNQLIRFLLCFASAREEGYCSRYSLPTLPDTFMKGLLVQGLTSGGIGERSISFNQVASSKFPLTHIDLDPKLKVRRVNPLTHAQARKSLLLQELRALWTSSAFVSPTIDPFSVTTKPDFTCGGGFVKELMDELAVLPPEKRYGRILLFRRALHSKAMSLIIFLHSIIHLPSKEKHKFIRDIPSVFGWDEIEYAIIQVAAEKLKPGIMKRL